ncbi:copper resistance protein CopC [Candidatus Saccharibacteria bacterium]|nr:copper resistance protein CopC [Candidatus Saccharibacteria bacterium]
MKKFLPWVAAIALILAGGTLWLVSRDNRSGNGDQQIKSPHFVDSTPLHGETYAAQPVNVTINFNFDIADNSEIKVNGGGREWTAAPTKVEDAQTALKADLKPGMPDGEYIVEYRACWPDKSCHDGQFSFRIDSSDRTGYRDLRGKKEVTIRMASIAFSDPKILVSTGTEVTWVNDDEAGHFVNTETHPEHTYFPGQNSREIPKGGEFKTTFNTLGQYSYHCSAHYPGMVASLIVSE